MLLIAPGALAWADGQGYPFAREKGAIYVADFLKEDEEIRFKVKQRTAVFSTKDAQRVIGHLSGNQEARLEAFTKFALRVRGRGTSGAIVGWVNPRDLEAPAPDLLDKLRAADERRQKVAALIAENRVAIGMTLEEVAESLGEPTKKTSRIDQGGRIDRWEWTTYEKVPRYNYVRDPYSGATYRQFSHYEKIERGKTVVEFSNAVATAIEEAEDLSRKRDLAIVPAPLVLIGP